MTIYPDHERRNGTTWHGHLDCQVGKYVGAGVALFECLPPARTLNKISNRLKMHVRRMLDHRTRARATPHYARTLARIILLARIEARRPLAWAHGNTGALKKTPHTIS